MKNDKNQNPLIQYKREPLSERIYCDQWNQLRQVIDDRRSVVLTGWADVDGSPMLFGFSIVEHESGVIEIFRRSTTALKNNNEKGLK